MNDNKLNKKIDILIEHLNEIKKEESDERDNYSSFLKEKKNELVDFISEVEHVIDFVQSGINWFEED